MEPAVQHNRRELHRTADRNHAPVAAVIRPISSRSMQGLDPHKTFQ